jgi:dihydroceramidase
MQLVDELSMIYSTCLMCHATFSYARSRIFSTILAFALVSLAVFITLYYHYLQDPEFHQLAYAILTAVVIFRSMYMMEWHLRPAFKRNDQITKSRGKKSRSKDGKQQGNQVLDEQILKEMWKMVAVGLSIFLGGFAVWTLDNQYCSSLRAWRRRVGLPWGIISEGHGWW